LNEGLGKAMVVESRKKDLDVFCPQRRNTNDLLLSLVVNHHHYE
jgi:hypothetical protein